MSRYFLGALVMAVGFLMGILAGVLKNNRAEKIGISAGWVNGILARKKLW